MSSVMLLRNYLFLWSVFVGLVLAQNASTSEIIRHLVPNIVPNFTPTIGPFVITYPQGIVNYGNALNLSVVTYNPLIQFSGEPDYPNARYTILMVDPDAPTPQSPTSAFIRHWLVSNVSPSTTGQNYSSGNVLSAYLSPSPPQGSAAHRYTTLLLRQGPMTNVSIYNQTSTQMFNVTRFVQQNALTYVSANYFNASRTNSSSASPSGTAGGNRATSPTSTASAGDMIHVGSSSAVVCSIVSLLALCFVI